MGHGASAIDGRHSKEYLASPRGNGSESGEENNELGIDDDDDEREEKLNGGISLQNQNQALNSAFYGMSNGGSDPAKTDASTKVTQNNIREVQFERDSGKKNSNILDSNADDDFENDAVSQNGLQAFDSFRVKSPIDMLLSNHRRGKNPNPVKDAHQPAIKSAPWNSSPEKIGSTVEIPEEEDMSTADDTDADPMNILLQFIPYYNQGNPSTDSMVRATLQGLAIEDIDRRDGDGNTLLLLACQYRCEDLVRIMLNKGADPNACNMSGACGLHFACYKDTASKPIAKILLQNGANPEVKEVAYGCTPLHYCANFGDIEFCKLLVSKGALVTTYDSYNYTPVDYARDSGNVVVAKYLQVKHTGLPSILPFYKHVH